MKRMRAICGVIRSTPVTVRMRNSGGRAGPVPSPVQRISGAAPFGANSMTWLAMARFMPRSVATSGASTVTSSAAAVRSMRARLPSSAMVVVPPCSVMTASCSTRCSQSGFRTPAGLASAIRVEVASIVVSVRLSAVPRSRASRRAGSPRSGRPRQASRPGRCRRSSPDGAISPAPRSRRHAGGYR